MLTPHAQSLPPLGQVLRSIVDTGNTGFDTADMIDGSLDDVRRNPQFAHARHRRSAKIVNDPMAYRLD